MLVLTRRQGQFITVKLPSGEILIIQVVAVQKNGQVRVGIDAPKSIEVNRGTHAEDALKKLKLEVAPECSDETFVDVWANMPIPAMNKKTARELTMRDPAAIKDVVEQIKRNFS